MSVAVDLTATPVRPAGRFFGRHGRAFGLTLLILILGFLSLYPMGMLFYGSLHSTPPGMAGVFNLDGYIALGSDENLSALINTVAISLRVPTI